MANTLTVRDTVDFVRSFPKLTSVLGNPVSGYTNQPALTFANNVVSEMFAPPFAWKWNRVVAPAFITNSLQQDYSTSITDLAWVENCTRTQITSTANPKPIRAVEVVRELQPTSQQSTAGQVCWIPNSQAICGTWAANVVYTNNSAVPGASMPAQPLAQIRDSNGNIQVATGFNDLGFGLEFGIGFGEGGGNSGSGTTGATQPTWATTPGAQTVDNTVVWTCVDPDGITFRVCPIPPQTGIIWAIQPVYQKKVSRMTSVSSTWPVPDDLAYVYQQGFLAMSMKAAGDRSYEQEYQTFQQLILKAVGNADIERDSAVLYPGESLMGGSVCAPEDFTSNPFFGPSY